MFSRFQRVEGGASSSALIVIAVAVLVLGLFLARSLVSSSSDRDGAAPQQVQTTQNEQAPQVNAASDLKAAEDFVNATDVDATLDTSEIDAALDN